MVRRLDHVVLDIGPEPVLRPKDAGESDPVGLHEPIDHMAKRVIDGCVVADDADTSASKAAGGE
jgi:hypothetical protein